jgi:hypothetical protein
MRSLDGSRNIEHRRQSSGTTSAISFGLSPWIRLDRRPPSLNRPAPSTRTWTSTGCACRPTPWRTPAAPTPSCSATCTGRDLMCEGAGHWTSSFQKTAKAVAYHCEESPPRIAVAALLRLAEWCQDRLATEGGTPCLPPPTALSPPAVNVDAGAPRGAVAPADAAAATRPDSSAQRSDSTSPRRRRRQGGGR